MITKILTIISFTLFYFISLNNNQKLSVQLIDIQYYSDCDCSESSPILVLVKFKVDETDLTDLKIMIKYSNGVTLTTKIKEKDAEGNIIYSFCSKKDVSIDFSVTFLKSNGLKSNEININSDLKYENISDETPPFLIKID